MTKRKPVYAIISSIDNWKEWRQEHPDRIIDLKGACLDGKDLSGVDLIGADLRNAQLIGTNLTDANLMGANLAGADLTDAQLIEADLGAAKLNNADLSGANLTGANLSDADLLGASLRWALLSDACLDLADLGAVRLDGANLSRAHLNRSKLDKAVLLRTILVGAELYQANLREAEIGSNADLSYADLSEANPSGSYLEYADLSEASLRNADLSNADLRGANLTGADLTEASLRNADLSKANLSEALLIRTDFTDATLIDCSIHGVSAWGVLLKGATQRNLVITDYDEPDIRVDNLKVAQFIYMLLDNQEIRDVIDTIAKKAVLILGRFTPKRKAVLCALMESLRTHGYIPILFDFEKPASLDMTETVSTLAHLARFIIADLTEPSSIPKELEAIVPTLAVPVQPLLEGSTRPYAMFRDYWKYQWVLELYRYDGLKELLASLEKFVIGPAERKAKELAKLRAEKFMY